MIRIPPWLVERRIGQLYPGLAVGHLAAPSPVQDALDKRRKQLRVHLVRVVRTEQEGDDAGDDDRDERSHQGVPQVGHVVQGEAGIAVG